MKKVIQLTLLLFLQSIGSFAQNLIINPSAESGASTGWTIVQEGLTGSTDCYNNSDWRIIGGANGYPDAQDSNYYFFPGCKEPSTFTAGTSLYMGEIYQDVDVSGYAVDIDAGNADFNFTCYFQTFDHSNDGFPDDDGQIIVEYLDGVGSILDTFDTGKITSSNIWTLISNTRTAPVNTKTIRIRLLSHINLGWSCDTYFDNLSLTTTSFPVNAAKVIESQDIIQLYPNPATTNSSINIELPTAQESIIQIFNLQGRLMQSINTTSDVAAINMTDFTKGMYLIKVITENATYTQQLIVQ